MNIKVDEIRLLLTRALDYYQESYKEETVVIPKDYYWQISGDDMFNFAKNPNEFQLGVGSFDDEIPQLLESLKGDDIIDFNQLKYLAYVLVYMSDRVLSE